MHSNKKKQKQSKIYYLIAFYKTMEKKPLLKRTIFSMRNINIFSTYSIKNRGNVMSHFDLVPKSLLALGNSDMML